MAAGLATLRHHQRQRSKVQSETKREGHEVTLALLSQNVRGFPAAGGRMTEWFQSFRQRESEVQIDMVLLQETHVTTAEITATTDAHCRNWGFDPAIRETPLSFWSPADDKKGGVGILMNPFSAITEVEPYLEEHWTPHWMAVTAVMDDVAFHVLNVYAPTVKPEREAVFRELHTHFAHLEEPLWVGGDFNSTQLRSLDRSFSTGTDTHHSRALASLLLDRALTDVAEEAIAEAVTEEQVGQFRSLHHTFFYRLPDGSPASSRLDRWYVSTQMYEWVRKVQVVIPGPGSDHNGVLLLICNPRRKRRRKGIAPAYPVPLYAAAEADKVATRILDSFELALAKMPDAEMGTQRHAEVWARKWDELKYEIRAAYRSTRRE